MGTTIGVLTPKMAADIGNTMTNVPWKCNACGGVHMVS